MKISFIATILNEEKNIDKLLHSIVNQSRKADEIVIVDGGSVDSTRAKIFNFDNKIKLIVKKGNRAVGRNEAIKNASNEIIVCSDAGCVLDKDWTKNIIKPFENPKVDVVAGYYKGKPNSVFEKCLVPYVLVMPDKINADNFLPATRSMAFKKSIWGKAGRFSEEYSHNEDYVFAQKLKKIKAKIFFQKKAVVYWLPKKNLGESLVAFYSFSLGDAEAKIFRPKVILLFFRYLIAFTILIVLLITKLVFFLNLLLILVAIYAFWSIVKNYKYINNWRAFYFLPEIQITSDLAVMLGTIVGLFSAKNR